MKNFSFLPLVSLMLVTSTGLITSANATIMIVDWGGDYVSENKGFTGEFDTSATDAPSGYGGFPGGELLSLTPISGYTGGNLYGAIVELPDSSGEYGDTLNVFNGIENTNEGDRIQLKGDNGIDPTAFLLLWDKADFLEGGSTADVRFDATSSIRVNFGTLTGHNAADSGRLVLRLGEGSYYMSEQVFTSAGEVTVGDLAGLEFFEYDPATTLNFNSGSVVSAAIASEGSITGITGIGVYFESDETSNPDAVRISDFEVIAADTLPIPEPSTYAVLSGLFGLSAALIRRRRR